MSLITIMTKPIWKTIAMENCVVTERLKVPGGWLYRCIYDESGIAMGKDKVAMTLVFVPTLKPEMLDADRGKK